MNWNKIKIVKFILKRSLWGLNEKIYGIVRIMFVIDEEFNGIFFVYIFFKNKIVFVFEFCCFYIVVNLRKILFKLMVLILVDWNVLGFYKVGFLCY